MNSTVEDSFQITLPSNASKKTFPKNESNSFRIQLPRTINLNPLDEWEVALVHIQFPQNWPNIIETTRMAFIVQFEKGAFLEGATVPDTRKRELFLLEDQEFEEAKNAFMSPIRTAQPPFDKEKKIKYIMAFDIPSGHYESLSELGEFICEKFKQLVVAPWKDKISPEKEVIGLDFSYDPLSRKTRFLISGPIDCAILCKNNYIMSNILGQDAKWTEKEAEGRKALYWYELPSIGSRPASLEILTAMYIYSDLCKYQIVGDTEAPLLGIVPLQPIQAPINPKMLMKTSSFSQQNFHVFNPPYYIPLAKHQVNEIRIELKTDYGASFPFANDANNMVCCRLHFRKGRKDHMRFLL